MDIGRLPMNSVNHDGMHIAYLDVGQRSGMPILLVHGFASTAHVNWVFTGWVKTLVDEGYRVVALDNRGHGESAKPHDPNLYTPDQMAGDSLAILRHLDISQAHIMGYSMGARLCAFLALSEPGLVQTIVFGGLGSGLVDGVGDWNQIADALLAPSIDDVTDAKGRAFRAFADQTGSDKRALAACIEFSRTLVARQDLAKLTMPSMVAVGTKDDIAGSARALADMLPNGQAFDILNRDHMLAVGDRTYKAAVLQFYQDHATS